MPRRFDIITTPSIGGVEYEYHGKLTGTLHKWVGPRNDHHDGTSLYGHSFLQGGRKEGDHLSFPAGATWTLGFFDDEIAERVVQGIMRDPRIAFGMIAAEVREVSVPHFGRLARFAVNGAVLARQKRPDGGQDHLTFDNPAADEALTRSLQWRLQKAGFTGEHLNAEVGFDRTYRRARTRLIQLHDIKFRCSECPVIIRGTPEAIAFAYVVGVGELTGNGLGALM